MKNKINTREIVLLSVIIFTFIILAGVSLSTITNIKINTGESTVQSDKDLKCYWTITETSEVNVTWYMNNQENRTLSISCTAGVECNTSTGSGTVPSSNIRKGQVWTCEIEYMNSTSGYEMNNVSVTITDTPPTEPKIYYSNSTEIMNSTIIVILEDSTTILDANSTDVDPTDTIVYSLNDTTYCSIDSSTGMITCDPTQESHVGFRTIEVDARAALATIGHVININVTAINDAPTFNPELSQRNFTNGEAFNYRIIGADAENNTPLNLLLLNVTPYLNLTISVVNDNTFYLMLANNRTATYPEVLDKTYTITLSLNDTDTITNNSKSINTSFQLVGISHNTLPNITYTVFDNTSLFQGGDLNIMINASDENNDTLTFATGTVLYPINGTSETFYANTTDDPSRAYAWINVTGLTNDHVIQQNLTVYVFDTKGNNTAIITMTINNTNDAPIINEISNNITINTYNNTNISDMIAYTGVLLRYKVNATDIDDLTYDGSNTGIGTYSTNDTSNYYINATTGILEFIPSNGGNFTFIVTVTDNGGLNYSINASIEVLNNHDPTIDSPIIIECYEFDDTNWANECYYDLSQNVTDIDIPNGDYIDNYWTNSTIFNINDTTGIFNFTVNQSVIGNYTIMFNATDSRGGMNSTQIYLWIYNTNNLPNITSVNLPSENMIVGTPYEILYTAYDLDLDLDDYENLTFTSNITGNNVSVFNLTKISSTEAHLVITPISADYDGNYSINITVTDYYGNSTSDIMNIYIYNVTSSPTIQQITPFGTPYNNTINNMTWANASDFPNMATNISIYENNTYIFNQTSTADTDSYANSLTYQWYYDNILVNTSEYYTRHFDFFSSGNHTLMFVAIDAYGSNNTFTWNMNITNVNRPPTYNNGTIENLTISGSGFIPNYLTFKTVSGTVIPVFFDPDDEPSGRNYSEDNSTTLVFSSTGCPYATITFEQHRLNVDADTVGECYVIFSGSDFLNSSLSVSSEIILINITNVSQNTEPEQVPITIERSGGGTSTQQLPIPLPEEIEKPTPLNIIAPKLVTTYKNATIK
ncbi:MAG: hypothetical protein ACP5OA_01255, partial [Candidatus Woesearchaeota archaeon]